MNMFYFHIYIHQLKFTGFEKNWKMKTSQLHPCNLLFYRVELTGQHQEPLNRRNLESKTCVQKRETLVDTVQKDRYNSEWKRLESWSEGAFLPQFILKTDPHQHNLL